MNILLGIGVTKSQNLLQMGAEDLLAVGIPRAAGRLMIRQAHRKHPHKPRGKSVEV